MQLFGYRYGTAAIAVALVSAVQPLAAQSSARVNYDMPAQNLDDALRSIARISGVEILFDADVAAGKKAPALRGALTAEEAVRAVLSGSGLSSGKTDGAILIRTAAGRTLQENSSQPGGDGQDIVVTGSRIRGGGGTAPVITTTRQRIEDAGLSDLAGFARIVPQNFTGGQSPGVAGGGDQGGQNNINNSTTLNLRGLGPDATLTLINGHRVAYDALNQGVDISVIPLAAIERVEIIADGASALYGSDAVGGVANIILRRDYDGARVSARFGAATDGGNVQQQYSGVSGARWSSGGFIAALDYNRSTAILARDRDYTGAIDRSQTLIPSQAQASGVIAGRQRLWENVTFEFDAQLAHRTSRKVNAFSATSDVFTLGQINEPEVTTWSITPTIRIDLPARWQASLSATRGVSQTILRARRFASGVETPGRLVYENRFTGLEATAEGPLFQAPGGEARLAVGGGLRTSLLDIHVAQTVAGVTRVSRDATEQRKSRFAYAELSLPLIGVSNRRPLLEGLRLSAAVRYEGYSGVDEIATPKLGVIYQPHRDVELRATWGRSFKLPTLNQLNQIRAGALLPGAIFTPPVPAGQTVLLLSGGSPDLGAERATTWTISTEVRPRFADGLRLEASWFNIDYRDRIASPVDSVLSALTNLAYRDLVIIDPTADAVNAIIATLPLGLSNQSGQPFNPDDVAGIIDGGLRNAAQERLQGVDISAEYELLNGANERLVLSASASYLESDRRLSAGQLVVERAGRIFNPPNWRSRLGGTWQRDNVRLTSFVNYVGGTLNDQTPVFERVAPFVTLDLSAHLRTTATHGLLRDLEFRVSAANLLNERPDLIRNPNPASPPYDSTNQSPVGRFISLSVAKSW
jgi:outer membrane receptor protein involved in Fe transport